VHENRYASYLLMFLAIAVVCTTFLGCAPSITVQSNLDPQYKVNLKKAFVIIDTRKIDDATMKIIPRGTEFKRDGADTTNFVAEFLPILITEFELAGVEVKGHVVTGLELSADDIERRVNAFDPDAVLNVTEAWYMVLVDKGFMGLMETKTVTAIDLDAYILGDQGGERAVWKALLKSEVGASGGWEKMARALAHSLVNQLKEDGLIDPTGEKAPAPDGSSAAA
jgi:hypothetical protein